MITYVQVGNCWLNIQQIRAVWVEDQDNLNSVCRVEFDKEHVLEFKGDDAVAIRGYLKYHMTSGPKMTTTPT